MKTVTSDLRTLASQGGPIAIYARMALAYRQDRGVRLTAEEIGDLLWGDGAYCAALNEALQDVAGADSEREPEDSFEWYSGMDLASAKSREPHRCAVHGGA